MKEKNLKNKLVLNKVTIQNLSRNEAIKIKGGTDPTATVLCTNRYCGGGSGGTCEHHGNK